MSTPNAIRPFEDTPMEQLERRMLLSVAIEQTTLDVGEEPRSVVVADFNGDGSADIASANAGEGTLTLLVSENAGGFGATTIEVNGTPDGLAALDVDEDGDPDLAAFDTGSGSFLLFENDGQGGFEASEAISAGATAQRALLEDFDGDGSTDIAVAYADGTLTVFFPGVESPFEIESPFDDPAALFDGPFQKFFEGVVEGFVGPGDGPSDDGTAGEGGPSLDEFEAAFESAFIDGGELGISQAGWDLFWEMFVADVEQQEDGSDFDFIGTFKTQLQEAFFPNGLGQMELEIDQFLDQLFPPSFIDELIGGFEEALAGSLLDDLGADPGTLGDFLHSFFEDVIGDGGEDDGEGIPSEEEVVAAFEALGGALVDEYLGGAPGFLQDEFLGAYADLAQGYLAGVEFPDDEGDGSGGDDGGEDGGKLGWDGTFDGFFEVFFQAFEGAYMGEEGVLELDGQAWAAFKASFEGSIDTSAFGVGDMDFFPFFEEQFQQSFFASFLEGDPDAPIDTSFLDGFVGAFAGEFAGQGGFDASEEQITALFDEALQAFLDSAEGGAAGEDDQGGGSDEGGGFFDPFFEAFSDAFAEAFVPGGEREAFFESFDAWIDETATEGGGFGDEGEFPDGGDLRDFVEHQDHEVGLSLLYLASADFSGDGAADLAVSDVKTGKVHILINDGEGGFLAPVGFDVGAEPSSIVAGDVNGDGRADLLVASGDDDKIAVLFNTGEDLAAPVFVDVGNEPVFIGTVDFDGDGTLEIVTANRKAGTISVVAQEDSGLARVADLVAGAGVGSALGADLDGDGLPELITADGDAGTLTVFSFTFTDEDGEGDGLFVAAPDGIDLLASSDTGESDTDDVTALDNGPASRLSFEVKGVEPGATVRVYAGEVLVGEGVAGAEASSVIVETSGTFVLTEGVHAFTATQVVSGIESAASVSLAVTVSLPKVEKDPAPIVVKQNEAGETVIEVKGEGGAEPVEVNLSEVDEAPAITGQVLAAQKKPKAQAGKPDREFVAAQSDSGFVVFQGEQGEWKARNLTEEIGGAEPLSGNVVRTFTTPWGLVTFVGFNEDGDLLFYWQNGKDPTGESWKFINLYDGSLRIAGKETPEFVGDVAAWVTPWGALNIGGIDEDGQLQVIWWTPKSQTWSVSNLTEKFGGESLAGRLSAVAGLNSMRLTGVDTEGSLIEYVWERGTKGWSVNDVTAGTGSPLVAPGSVLTFRSETVEENGFRRVLTGAVSEAGDQVVIFRFDRAQEAWGVTTVAFPDAPEAILVGRVTGFTSETGVDTLVAPTSAGELFEVVFDPLAQEWMETA